MNCFISDLDNTLVYSKKEENSVCIEKRESKEITYITKTMLQNLTDLLNNKDFFLIPCTLRSIEQTEKISFINRNTNKYIICDNGASIYVDGKLDDEWELFIETIINKNTVYNLTSELLSIVEKENINIKLLKNNNNCFISLIFHDKENAAKYSGKLIKKIDTSIFDIYDQGKKLYIVPKKLNKEIAVKFLIKKYGLKNIITSGDSSFDEKFVKYGDIIIIPLHASFQIKNSIKTKNEGIKAGEEILLEIIKNI